jgi:hypothetical protein
MDPATIAALITAVFKAAPTIFDRVVSGITSKDAKVKDIVSKKYSDLQKLMRLGGVKLLKFAEDGTYHDVEEFRAHLYPDMAFKDLAEQKAFDHEFEYRLRYLVAIGFFYNATGEY